MERITASFAQQTLMQTLGATLGTVEAGAVEIIMPFNAGISQQHGYGHAGAITAIVDTACGYAAQTMMPPDMEVLTVEFKANFLAPAAGERFVAVGKVIKPGRTLTVCSGEVHAIQGDSRKLICMMQATMMAVKQHA